MTNRLIIAISGASGAIYGIRTLEIVRRLGIETHLIISHAAQSTIKLETDLDLDDVRSLADIHYAVDDIGASIASGSFPTIGMMVVPCSIKSLSAIASSYSNNLIVRAADVTLKEGRPLLLAVRETPLHPGHLRIMTLAAVNGAIIFPPVPSLYGKPKTLEELIDETVGRMLSRIGIDNSDYTQWEGV